MKKIHISPPKRLPRPSIVAFIMPVMILTIVYIARGVFPFGDNMYVRMDFYHQYAPFMKEFMRHILNGESLLYAWEYGLGTNYWAHYAYYLASPINWLLVLLPKTYVVEAMNLTLILRAGIAGSAFVYFLKEDRKESMPMAVFGIIYALSGYYLAYSCNIIWTDGYALFPLVMLGVKRIANGKSAKLYAVSMLICTFSNFYMAVIIGMCCILWLIICLVSADEIKFRDVLKAIGRFVVSTALYVGICAVILLPVAYALMNTPAGESDFPEKIEWYFAFYELFERMCMNAAVNLKGSDLPNIYASVFSLILLPVFFFHRNIRIKEKIVCGVILALLLVSFDLNVLDYIWHVLHFPNSFPARQSFFYIFLVLSMGHTAFAKRKEISPKVLYIAMPVLAAACGTMWYFSGGQSFMDGAVIYLTTILFIMLYGILFLLEIEWDKKFVVWILLAVCCLEIFANTYVVGVDSVVSRHSYMEDDAETAWIVEAIRPEEGTFYRVEEQDRHTVNDAGWDGYYGASYFSSTIPGGVKEWYDAFGMRNSSVSYSYEGATPLVASLLGVRYVFASEDNFHPGASFTEYEYEVEGELIHLYENTQVLPLGYMVDEGLEDGFEYDFYSPFKTMNNYTTAVLGSSDELFTEVAQYDVLTVETFDVNAGAGEATDDSENVENGRAIEVPAGENVFIYVTTYMDEINVELRDKSTGVVEERSYDDLKFRKIISLGIADYDRTVTVYPADEDVDKVQFLSYAMNQEVLDRVYDVLSRQPMEIQSIEDRKFTGTINVTESGVLLLSIPYDAGWMVKVDGVETEIRAWKDAFMAVELTEGEHCIEFTYCPAGFRAGLAISSVSVLIALAILFKNRIKRKVGK